MPGRFLLGGRWLDLRRGWFLLLAGNGCSPRQGAAELAPEFASVIHVDNAARAVGIAPRTLCGWMNEPLFDKAYRKARRAAFGQGTARLQQASGATVSSILKIMVDPHAAAPTQLRAAELAWTHGAKAIGIEDVESRVADSARPRKRATGGETEIKAVHKRIPRLEDQFRVALKAMRKPAVPEGPPPTAVVGAQPASMGIEPGPNQSLAGTAARALGSVARNWSSISSDRRTTSGGRAVVRDSEWRQAWRRRAGTCGGRRSRPLSGGCACWRTSSGLRAGSRGALPSGATAGWTPQPGPGELHMPMGSVPEWRRLREHRACRGPRRPPDNRRRTGRVG